MPQTICTQNQHNYGHQKICVLFSFPQQYQKTAEDQYSTILADYEERVQKAREEGILASKSEEEENKPKRKRVMTNKRASSTKKKLVASTSKKSTTKKATGAEKSSHDSSQGVLWV